MMKYYKSNNQVFAFESDGSQDEFITPHMLRMTDQEVDKHINPTNYLSEEQKYNNYLNSLPPLTRRQFKLVLLENNLFTQIDTAISSIEDVTQRTRIEIEYTEASEFVRTSDSVKYMCNILGLTEEQINTMWQQALSL